MEENLRVFVSSEMIPPVIMCGSW